MKTVFLTLLFISSLAQASPEADKIDSIIQKLPGRSYVCNGQGSDQFILNFVERDFVNHTGFDIELYQEGVDSSYIHLTAAYLKNSREVENSIGRTAAKITNEGGLSLVKDIPNYYGVGRYERIVILLQDSSTVQISAKRTDKKLFVPYRVTKMNCVVVL